MNAPDSFLANTLQPKPVVLKVSHQHTVVLIGQSKYIFKESALRPILSSSRDVCLFVGCPFPMRFSQGSKGGPRGANPVGLLEEHVHLLQFLDEKMCSKTSRPPRRARPSAAIS